MKPLLYLIKGMACNGVAINVGIAMKDLEFHTSVMPRNTTLNNSTFITFGKY